ncbi:hypothetical protein G7046_g1961 [Stylonectria norvegica]|nr:hypothetical protein G7046_g1961 [Stylonectria norvegica]
MPSSLSVLRSNSDPETSTTSLSSSASSSAPRNKLWKKSATVTDLSSLRGPEQDSELRSPKRRNTGLLDAVLYGRTRSRASDAHKPGVLVPPRPRPGPRKSRTWGNRISSLLPSLMSSPTESAPAPPRQPPPPPPPPPPPQAPPSPPTHKAPVLPPNRSPPSPPTDGSISSASQSLNFSSLSIIEPEPTPRMAEIEDGNGLGIGIARDHSLDDDRDFGDSPSILTGVPFLDSPIPEFQMPPSIISPQIMAPIPPSPEMKRATLEEEDEEEEFAIREEAQPVSPEKKKDEATKSGKLHKSNPSARQRRSGSLQRLKNEARSDSLKSLKTSHTPGDDRGRRSTSAQSPSSARNSLSSNRVTSTPLTAPPVIHGDVAHSPTRGRLRRSWLPGSNRSRSNSMEVNSATANASAWVISDDSKAEYNATFLKNAEKVPELWNEMGTVQVYLYPRGSGSGPSFRVPEFTVSSSYIFNELIQSERDSPTGRSRTRSFGGRDSLSADDANRWLSPPSSPSLQESNDDLRLYLPTAPPSGVGQLSTPGTGASPELDRLIGIRNLFAFLTGQPLVATKNRPTNFQALLQISGLLLEFGFTSMDGTSFGDAVDLSFSFYMDQLGLADCRLSREKTVEALVLGERMRSVDLYNEAFAHAAGKYSAIIDLRLPLFEQLTEYTRQGLERAHLDLVGRQHNINIHLEQFEFPALFAGIANSTSVPELRHVRFKVWRNSFMKMRQFVQGHYKTTFGNWPPKASSKKNPFAESGLNRLVLKVLYSDMCALYDLLVDRTNLTSRVMDEVPSITDAADKMTMSALRNIMSEFDRSKPPVLPPIPYDCPQLPSPTSVLETYSKFSPKEQLKFDRGIKEHELILILNKAYNYDTNSIKLPFLDQFKAFELREGRGKTGQDLADQRIGYWLFLYVTIQSLPVLVVDAPGMSFTEGVEYFLCEPPMGNPPWYEDRQVRKMWYEVAGGGGLVELSTDAVLFSVEATYHRSHCWLAAKQWDGHSGSETHAPIVEPAMSPLQPPRGVFPTDEDTLSPPPMGGANTPSPPLGGLQAALRPRTQSPHGSRANQAWRSSIALGLEPVPLEPPNPFGGFPDRRSSLGPRPISTYMDVRSASMSNLALMNNQPGTPPEPVGATFDDILGAGSAKKPTKKKKSRFL